MTTTTALSNALLSFLTLDEVTNIYSDTFERSVNKGVHSELMVFKALRDRRDMIASFFNNDALKNNMKLYNLIYRHLSVGPWVAGDFYGPTLSMNAEQYDSYCKVIRWIYNNENNNRLNASR